MHEVQERAGQLAAEKARREEVRRFGQALGKEHAHAADVLSDLAVKDGVLLGSESVREAGAPAVDDDPVLTQLRQVPASSFDRAFAQLVASQHRLLLAQIENVRAQAESDELRGYLDQQETVARGHLREALQLTGAPRQAQGRRATR
jgi:putative membrane protein